mmetsp:Transcript_43379/g.77960  ORF Transcript_43379/g.77960 Transcript_43379/m.77960 type:complete len:239 (+) Transcript_43379:898-1614(+)
MPPIVQPRVWRQGLVRGVDGSAPAPLCGTWPAARPLLTGDFPWIVDFGEKGPCEPSASKRGELEDKLGLWSRECPIALDISKTSAQSGGLRLTSRSSNSSFLLISICLRQPNFSRPKRSKSSSDSVSKTGPLMALALRMDVASGGNGVQSSHWFTWSTVQSLSCNGVHGPNGCRDDASRKLHSLLSAIAPPAPEPPPCITVPPVPAPSVSTGSSEETFDKLFSLSAALAFRAAQFWAY